MARARNPEGPREQRPSEKRSTSYRLSPDTLRRIDDLAARLHVARSAVLELAVKDLARKEGVS